MNQTAAIPMNTRRSRPRYTVCSPVSLKRRRRAEMLTAAFDGICYLVLMVCLVLAITVLVAIL